MIISIEFKLVFVVNDLSNFFIFVFFLVWMVKILMIERMIFIVVISIGVIIVLNCIMVLFELIKVVVFKVVVVRIEL